MRSLAFGLSLAVIGAMTYCTGTDKYGLPVFNWVGFIFIGAGLPFVGYGIYSQFMIQKPRSMKSDFICPKCESVYSLPEDAEHTCPHDSTTMEPLKGYYIRHPERRDKPITENKT